MDEYGYYAVKGFAVVPAQARSLGFSAIFAGQDLPAFQKASKEEALSIGANTNIKIAMKLEDPIETWDFFNKTAGEAYVTKVDSFQTNQSGMFNNYMDTRSASAEKRQRVDLLDLKEQREGESHIFFKSSIVRAKMFYANPAPVPRMRLNHFVKVASPDIKQLVALEQRLLKFSELLKSGDFRVSFNEKNDAIDLIATTYQAEETNKPLIEKGVAALIAYYNQTAMPEVSVEEEKDEIETSAELGVFNRIYLHDLARSMLPSPEMAEQMSPLLLKNQTKQGVNYLLRLLGKNEQYSTNVAQELVHDMEVATKYPPVIEKLIPVAEVVKMVDIVTASINGSDDSGSAAGEEPPLGGTDLADAGSADGAAGGDDGDLGGLGGIDDDFSSLLDDL
jgi:intracellular multiplication protein IcmO